MSTITLEGAASLPVTYDGNPVTFQGNPVDQPYGANDLLLINTLTIEDQLDARSTASFQTVHLNGVNNFTLGQAITLKSDGTTLFAGVIDQLNEREDVHGRLFCTVNLVDYTALLDRHLIAGAYENEAAGDIVADLLTDSTVSTLEQENLTSTNVATGPDIAKIVFNYVTATEALQELANYSGYYFTVTPDKDVTFQPRTASTAPFSVTDTSRNYRNLLVARDKSEYRNRQLVRAGQDLTSSRTETFDGDGETQSFTLAYPAGTAPTVTVNASAETVGILGVDSSKDWYWNKGSRTITQDDGGTRLTAGDTLSVTYQGLFPILVIADNTADQEARAALEDTSGVYANVTQDASLDDRDNAATKAEALLARYGQFEAGIEFETDELVEPNCLSLRAGDLLSVTKPAHDLNDTCLVERVSWRRASPARWVLQVRALTGTQTTAWLRYWRELRDQQQGLAIRENEVVVVAGQATSYSDTVTFTDTCTPVSASPESQVGSAVVGFSEAA